MVLKVMLVVSLLAGVMTGTEGASINGTGYVPRTSGGCIVESRVNGASINGTRYVTGGDGSAIPLVSLGGTEYHFETHLTLNWYAASEFCQRKGLFLVSVESAEENSLLKNYLSQSGVVGSFWTSGSDFASHGHFVWASTGENLSFTNWAAGEPSHGGGGTSHERAIHFFYNTHFLWNDKNPYYENYFICENINPY